jgi:hypothetical protein
MQGPDQSQRGVEFDEMHVLKKGVRLRLVIDLILLKQSFIETWKRQSQHHISSGEFSRELSVANNRSGNDCVVLANLTPLATFPACWNFMTPLRHQRTKGREIPTYVLHLPLPACSYTTHSAFFLTWLIKQSSPAFLGKWKNRIWQNSTLRPNIRIAKKSILSRR